MLKPAKTIQRLLGHGLIMAAGALLLTASTACDKNGHVNLLSVDDDKKLGAQTAAQIAADPTTYPILDPNTHQQAYAYLNAMKQNILNSGKLTYKDDFPWEMHIIKADSILNAFCTPGGYIYVYTGLINYLDSADHLAGVLGHEMGHADLRHTSREITRTQGYDLVLQVALGQNPGALASVATQIIGLSYSRGYETEADEASVKFLSGTDYACNGAAGFFRKLLAHNQGSSQPVFLSTHPADKARVDDITKTSNTLNCDKTPISETGMTYAQFQASVR